MIQAIHSHTVYVHNQTEAVRFYKEALGFEIRRWEPLGPAGSWIEMGPPGSQACLVLYPEAMANGSARRGFVIFDCDDVAATHEELLGRGITFTQDPTNLGWAVFAVFADPDGNELGLLQVTRAAAVPTRSSRPPGGAPPPPPPPRK